MRTIETTLYVFNELSKTAQLEAIEANRTVDGLSWSGFTIEEAEGNLDTMGFSDAKIMFTGFWSQGDGACFTCNINLEKFCEKNGISEKYSDLLKEWEKNGDTMSIKQKGHYLHEMTMYIDNQYSFSYNKTLCDKLAELEDIVLESARKEAEKIYSTLKEKYEYSTSDEVVQETLIANEYEFLEQGGEIQ
jgi:hypothetical protein